jgi:hypothetical protein
MKITVSLKKEDERDNYMLWSFVIYTPPNIRRAIKLRNMRYDGWDSSYKQIISLFTLL